MIHMWALYIYISQKKLEKFHLDHRLALRSYCSTGWHTCYTVTPSHFSWKQSESVRTEECQSVAVSGHVFAGIPVIGSGWWWSAARGSAKQSAFWGQASTGADTNAAPGFRLLQRPLTFGILENICVHKCRNCSVVHSFSSLGHAVIIIDFSVFALWIFSHLEPSR